MAKAAVRRRSTCRFPPANPLGTFPGQHRLASQIAGSTADQLFTSGLRTSRRLRRPATITGILTNPNFQVVIHALEQRTGVEIWREPEVTTTSGRQTQMRATADHHGHHRLQLPAGHGCHAPATTGTTQQSLQ